MLLIMLCFAILLEGSLERWEVSHSEGARVSALPDQHAGRHATGAGLKDNVLIAPAVRWSHAKHFANRSA